MKKTKNSKGFTLIEILLTISLITIASVLLLVNITRPKGIADIKSTENLIYTTIKEAQITAMAGSASDYGVHFEQDRFIFFEGSTFTSGDPNNLETTLNNNLTINFIDPPIGNNIVFSQLSGEVRGLTLGQSVSFELKESNTNESKVFTITSLGAIDVD